MMKEISIDRFPDGIQMSTIESAIDLRDIQAELYRRIVDVFVWHEDD